MMRAVIGKSGSKAVHELATLGGCTGGRPARCKGCYPPGDKEDSGCSGGEAELHPPRGTCAVGTPLTSATEAYSLTKLPLLPKRKTKITRPGVHYNLFFFFFFF